MDDIGTVQGGGIEDINILIAIGLLAVPTVDMSVDLRVGHVLLLVVTGGMVLLVTMKDLVDPVLRVLRVLIILQFRGRLLIDLWMNSVLLESLLSWIILTFSSPKTIEIRSRLYTGL